MWSNIAPAAASMRESHSPSCIVCAVMIIFSYSSASCSVMIIFNYSLAKLHCHDNILLQFGKAALS